jgi:2,3-bisphosphoglycerate-independent phosphoglycerate mutase
MSNFDLMRELIRNEGGKIVLLVLDGLGGLPMGEHRETTLEYAATPNMDRLAAEGCQGLSYPVGRGITPGSGPAHLACAVSVTASSPCSARCSPSACDTS